MYQDMTIALSEVPIIFMASLIRSSFSETMF